MGACGSSTNKEEAALAASSRAIDKKNKEAFQREQMKIKLLLLGTGESGKSTIFKQMKILYGQHHGFTKEERERFRPTVYGNIISNMKIVLDNTEAHTPLAAEYLKSKIDFFMGLPDGKDAKIDDEIGELVKALWADSGFQETWTQRSNFQVQDALEYYCKEIDRIKAADYIPNPQDILRARVRTSGIVEEQYKIDGVTFAMYDVGGQRNERKKWIHCFDNVTAVIFVAAINEYDQVLYEDQTMRRIDEAVIVFQEICNSPYFKNTSMILFLNKNDLFRQKLETTPFRVDEPESEARFIDYEGPSMPEGAKQGSDEYEKVYESVKRYFVQLFLNRNKNPDRQIYHHVTCSVDTRNVEVVFNASKDIILQSNLKNSGFVVS